MAVNQKYLIVAIAVMLALCCGTKPAKNSAQEIRREQRFQELRRLHKQREKPPFDRRWGVMAAGKELAPNANCTRGNSDAHTQESRFDGMRRVDYNGVSSVEASLLLKCRNRIGKCHHSKLSGVRVGNDADRNKGFLNLILFGVD